MEMIALAAVSVSSPKPLTKRLSSHQAAEIEAKRGEAQGGEESPVWKGEGRPKAGAASQSMGAQRLLYARLRSINSSLFISNEARTEVSLPT